MTTSPSSSEAELNANHSLPIIPVNVGQTFDSELFGLLMRKARRDAGYSTVEAFIEAVRERAGLSISKDTWYKIESGKSKPTLEHILAVNITLYGRANAPQFWKAIEGSSSKWRNDLEREWENIAPGWHSPVFDSQHGYWLGTVHEPILANPAR